MATCQLRAISFGSANWRLVLNHDLVATVVANKVRDSQETTCTPAKTKRVDTRKLDSKAIAHSERTTPPVIGDFSWLGQHRPGKVSKDRPLESQ